MNADKVRRCDGNCSSCGKCLNNNFGILDSFSDTQLAFTPREGFGVAIDLGTTSVALLLLDLQTGRPVGRRSFMNPQRVFGADVISRIDAAGNGNLTELTQLIQGAFRAHIPALLDERKVSRESVTQITLAGNTAMVYLLLGFPCDSLGVYPFQPAYTLQDSYTYADISGSDELACPVMISPWFAAFAGGDLLAGLIHVLDKKPRRFLLIDLGTNGELALYDHGRLLVTSTAAGPAFEGGQTGGASYVLYETARLLETGIMDETGRLLGDAPFTQADIRAIQLAKSAVRTGVEILLAVAGLSYDELDAVYLAGGIGQAVHVESAIALGLLPDVPRVPVMATGNAALGGAVQALLLPEQLPALKTLRAGADDINLAAHPLFNDYFMDYMQFGQ